MPRSSPLTVSLSRRHRKLVEAEIESGRRTSIDEIVGKGLELYERELDRARTTERLRDEIAVGTKAVDRGDVVDARRAMTAIKTKLLRRRTRGV